MELRNLETFVKIAALGSFTKAADELSITQPAATRQIAALEQELRTRLLERLGKRVELTDAGRALVGYATDIVRLAEEASKAVGEIASGARGHVALGASSTTVTYLLGPLLRRFHDTHPAVDVSVRTAPSRTVAEMVIRNEVDLGLVMEAREVPGMRVIKLADYANVAVVPPDHPLASSGDGITVADLAGAQLVLMQPGTTQRAWADRLIERAQIAVDVIMELDSVEAIKAMVEARLGISILPLIAIRNEVDAGRLVALRLNDATTAAEQQIAFIHRDDKFITAAMRSLMGLVGERFGDEGR